MLLRSLLQRKSSTLNANVGINKARQQSRSVTELLHRIKKYGNSIAVSSEVDSQILYTYNDLDFLSTHLAEQIRQTNPTISNVNVIGAYHPHVKGANYIVSMLTTWKLGKIFLPLSTSHPEHELKYFITDSKMGLLLHSSASNEKEKNILENLEVKLLDVDKYCRKSDITPTITTATIHNNTNVTDYEEGNGDEGALVLYTSGTTGKPKGVLHTRDGVKHMMKALTTSWQYSANDKILHFLPLHHLHGVLNKLLCMLWAGGEIEFLESASAKAIWKRLAHEGNIIKHSNSNSNSNSNNEFSNENNKKKKSITLFHAVPTVYSRMLEASKLLTDNNITSNSNNSSNENDVDEELKNALLSISSMRLMTCGSAALPDTILNNWYKLTGKFLLERYGMTELGMVCTNPYIEDKERNVIRRKGCVGSPLLYTECRIVDENEVEVHEYETPGELRVRGKCVFKEYLNRPDVTASSFDDKGFFKTGDIAVRVKVKVDNNNISDGHTNTRENKENKEKGEEEDNKETGEVYRLLGRSSTDIIKSAGYKLSALEIEREILSHPQISEAAVIAIADDALGEKVGAVIVLNKDRIPSDLSTNMIFPYNNSSTEVVGKEKEKEKEKETYNLAVLNSMKSFLKERLAPYKQPKTIWVVNSIPRNHLGKVNKKTLLKDLNINTVQ